MAGKANGSLKRQASTRAAAVALASSSGPPASSSSAAAKNGVAEPRKEKVARTSEAPSRAATPQPRTTRASSTLPATPTRRRLGPPVYIPKNGINPLPRPIRPTTSNDIFDGFLVNGPPLAAEDKVPATAQDVVPRQLFVFGNGDMGQHGLGTDVLDEIKRPRKHIWVDTRNASGDLGPAGLEAIAAGGMHTLAIDSNGRLWSWGINDNAALGRLTDREEDVETEVFETEPMPVEGLAPNGIGILPGLKQQGGGKQGAVETFRATRIAAGDSVSVALSDDGQIRVWGSFRSNDGLLGFDGQVGSSKTQFVPVALPALLPYSFSQITCGDDHILALATSGQVFSWGNGQQLQLGRRIIERRKINGLNPEKVGLKDVVLIGSGAYHSFAVDKKGEVYGWGLNSLRQVGLQTSEDTIATPRLIPALSPSRLSSNGDVRVVAITAGQHHSLFLLSDGRVFGCGRCDGCELGLAEDHPSKVQVKRMREEWRAKRSKELETEVQAWEQRMTEKRKANGSEASKAMGEAVSSDDLPPTMGPPPDEFVPQPVHVPFPGNVKIANISAGARFNLALDTAGKLYSWGFGNQSQLGLGDEESADVPTEIKSKQWKGYRGLMCSAGGQHSAVIAVLDARADVE